MSIDDVLEKLTRDERIALENYIAESIEEETDHNKAETRRNHEAEVEDAYDLGFENGHDYAMLGHDKCLRPPTDRWLVHNDLGHAGSLEMCDQTPCNLF